jgi:hypothetical protein
VGTATGVSAIVAMYVVLVGLVVWIGRRARRRRIGGNVLGAFDEIWHPAGYRHRIEVERHDERVEAAPAPGDPPQVQTPGLD